MKMERIIWIVALLVVGGVGFYSGQIIGGRLAAQNRAQAAQQFFNQRGGGQGQGGQGAGQGGGGAFRGNGGGGTAGTVTDVSGNTITLTTRNGQTAKVQLAATGTVRKQVDGQISDIKQGDQIVAIGTQNGDTFEANSIQVGGFGGGFGGAQGGGRGQGQGQGQQQQSPTAAP